MPVVLGKSGTRLDACLSVLVPATFVQSSVSSSAVFRQACLTQTGFYVVPAACRLATRDFRSSDLGTAVYAGTAWVVVLVRRYGGRYSEKWHYGKGQMAGEITEEHVWQPVREPAANIAFLWIRQCHQRGDRQGMHHWTDKTMQADGTRAGITNEGKPRILQPTMVTSTKCVCVQTYVSPDVDRANCRSRGGNNSQGAIYKSQVRNLALRFSCCSCCHSYCCYVALLQLVPTCCHFFLGAVIQQQYQFKPAF